MKCVTCNQSKEQHGYDKFCPTNDPEAVVEYLNGDGEEVDTYKPEFPKYLNVYRVEQSYGGPEEGGWWFDTGEPLESVQVDNATQEKQVQEVLDARYAPDPDDRERSRGRTSAAGGYDVCIRSEYHFAQPFPSERPRYE